MAGDVSAILAAMTARDRSPNHSEMVHLFVWIAERVECQPKAECLTVIMRLFAIPNGRRCSFPSDAMLVQSIWTLAEALRM